MEYRDYYQTLGVDRSASQADIKKAFRTLSKKFHPDLNKDDPKAEDKFKEANEAYEVLKDVEKRRRYDAIGSAKDFGGGSPFDFGQGPGGHPFGGGAGQPFGGGAGGFSDFFEAIFGQGTEPGGPMRPRPRPVNGRDHEVDFEISLEDAFFGASRTVNLSTLIKGLDGGRRREERSLKVNVPKSTRPGSKIRLKGQGEKGRNGGSDGSILLKVSIAPHSRFQFDGDDLTGVLELTPWEAALGAKVDFKTLDGSVRLSIPHGSQSGKKLRLRGKGFAKRSGGNGDLHVELQIRVPVELSEEEERLFRELQKASSFDPRANGKT
ncbi:MAG: J domain-containing protein [Deltaproteobacteria bacterium]|nr:J domain-containing protein [Deltaproteobacteria bacterium]